MECGGRAERTRFAGTTAIFAQQQRGAGWRVDLVPMMHLDNFYVPILGQAGRGLFNESSQQMNEKFRDILKAEGVDPASLNQFQISTRQVEHARAELAELPLTVVAGAWFQGMMLNSLAPVLLIEPRVRALNKGSFIDTTGSSFVDRIGNFLAANSSGYVAWALFGALTGSIAMLLQFAGWIQLYRWQPYAALFATLAILYFLLVNGPVASPK